METGYKNSYLVIKIVYGKSNKTALSEMAVNLVLIQYLLKIFCHLVKNVVLTKIYCLVPASGDHRGEECNMHKPLQENQCNNRRKKLIYKSLQTTKKKKRKK